jgi:small GTP-binding protein
MLGRYLFKIVLAGSGGCGKTTLLQRFTTGAFTSNTKMTIGVDFAVHLFELPNVGNITLQIWDFGGEERFRIMLPSFCLGASGCLLIFDLMRPNTFFELEEWMGIIRKNTNNAKVVLLGTKYDLLEKPEDLAIKPDEIANFIKKHNVNGYLNVSSKSGMNVQEAFKNLSLLMSKK